MSTEVKPRDASDGRLLGLSIAGEDRGFYLADLDWLADNAACCLSAEVGQAPSNECRNDFRWQTAAGVRECGTAWYSRTNREAILAAVATAHGD